MHKTNNKWNAVDYAKNSSAQESWASELIEKLSLQGHEHLLDIGCGDGKISNSIASKLSTGNVIGIDRSKNMIELATKQFNRQNLFFHVMDATELSLQGTFDVIFSNAVLHWVKDHKAILIRLKKHLHPESKILFQMGGYGNADDILKVVTQATKRKQWARYFENFVFPYNFYKIQDYEKWLQKTGYQAKRIELIPKDMIHGNSEKLKGWLRTTWFPYINQLPENEKEKFLNYITEQYIAVFPVDSAGKTHVKMVRLEVEANAIYS